MSTQSSTVAELFAALVLAQSEIAGAVKDSTNPHFKSKYADLASVWDACRKPLTKHGLAILQPARATGPEVTVTTILAHKSGEWLSEDLTLTATMNTPQGVGSALTYARRYGLASMVGIAPEDDDANEASRDYYKAPRHESTNNSVGMPEKPAPATVGDRAGNYHTTANTKPAHGGLRIERVDSAPTKNANVTKYRIVLSTGEEVTTIKTQLANDCEEYARLNAEVEVETQKTKWGTDLTGVRLVSRARLPEIDINADLAHTEAITVDDIPF